MVVCSNVSSLLLWIFFSLLKGLKITFSLAIVHFFGQPHNPDFCLGLIILIEIRRPFKLFFSSFSAVSHHLLFMSGGEMT